MTLAALLAELAAAGFRLRVEAGRLLVSPASQLTPAQRQAIPQHRDRLVRLVEGPGDPFGGLPPPQALWAATLAYRERHGAAGAASSPGGNGR